MTQAFLLASWPLLPAVIKNNIMCLAIPALITRIENQTATASVGGTTVEINLSLVEDVKENDYVLIHSGFALEKIDIEEAEKTLDLFGDFEEFNKKLDEEEKAWRSSQNNG